MAKNLDDARRDFGPEKGALAISIWVLSVLWALAVVTFVAAFAIVKIGGRMK